MAKAFQEEHMSEGGRREQCSIAGPSSLGLQEEECRLERTAGPISADMERLIKQKAIGDPLTENILIVL